MTLMYARFSAPCTTVSGRLGPSVEPSMLMNGNVAWFGGPFFVVFFRVGLLRSRTGLSRGVPSGGVTPLARLCLYLAAFCSGTRCAPVEVAESCIPMYGTCETRRSPTSGMGPIP
jgi:hypothetical protein